MGTVETGIRLDRALAIEGFMNTGEIDWIAQQAMRHSRICEVGSWTGRSTRAWADNTPGTVWCVDTWMGSKGDLDDIVEKHGRWWALDQFLNNLNDKLAWKGGNVHTLCMDSIEAAEQLRFRPRFDLIFIDACHKYEAVKADILAYMPLLSEGGLLCGHDYAERCPGVKKAVEELIPNFQLMENPNEERSIWWKPVSAS